MDRSRIEVPRKLRYEFRFVPEMHGGTPEGVPGVPGKDYSDMDLAASRLERSLVQFEKRIELATVECERIRRQRVWLFVEIGLFMAGCLVMTWRLML